VINDAIADTPLLLIGDTQARSVRAYERGNTTFTPDAGRITDQNGVKWRVTESAPLSDWFAWDNYMGDAATVYER
jgi:hypothetical protein